MEQEAKIIAEQEAVIREVERKKVILILNFI
jgi:hypothetical protein